jgi:hypothetical protein
MTFADMAVPAQAVSPPRALVSASDRCVSVRDNQERFEELAKTLDTIRDEFARDHNKGEYAALSAQAVLSDIEVVQAQIRRGLVHLDELRDRLRPSLKKLAKDIKNVRIIGGALRAAVLAAQKALEFILGV